MKFRTAFKNLIAQIGKQLITGKFNLTNTSFPIKCMSKDSILQVIGSVAGPTSFYLNSAAISQDPIERMKYTIIASFSYLFSCHTSFEEVLEKLRRISSHSTVLGSSGALEAACQ